MRQLSDSRHAAQLTCDDVQRELWPELEDRLDQVLVAAKQGDPAPAWLKPSWLVALTLPTLMTVSAFIMLTMSLAVSCCHCLLLSLSLTVSLAVTVPHWLIL